MISRLMKDIRRFTINMGKTQKNTALQANSRHIFKSLGRMKKMTLQERIARKPKSNDP